MSAVSVLAGKLYDITCFYLTESGGTTDEVAVMAMEEQPPVKSEERQIKLHYSNLVLVTTDVHRLLHAAKPETIRAYMDMLKPDKKQMAKINRLRKMLDLPSI